MKQSITYQNYQINYYCEGSGELLIFLHGWPTNSRLWDAQVDLFSKNYRVVTIDWLGFGQSDEPKDYTFTFSKKKEILDTLVTAVAKGDGKRAGDLYEEMAEARAAGNTAYPSGSKVVVHYNPQNVERAVLSAGANWGTYVPAIIGVVLFCFGALLLRLTAKLTPVKQES